MSKYTTEAELRMNPFNDWRFCLISALLMLTLVLTQGNGMAMVWGALMYANALMLFNKEGR